MILRSRSVTERSMIRARAMMEARSRNQMGQPAAWMIVNKLSPNRLLRRYSGTSPGTLSKDARRGKFARRNIAYTNVDDSRSGVVDFAISTNPVDKFVDFL